MKANVSWQGKVQFEAEVTSGHKITMDGIKAIGGQDKGASPVELLLSSVGGCSGIDVVMILEKMRQNLTSLNVEVTGQRNDDYPKRFTDIHAHFVLEGDVEAEKAGQAIQLSMEKYCTVSLTLNSNITYSYEVNGEKYTS